MFVLCIIEAFNWGILVFLCKKKFTAHPSLQWLTNAQYKHDPKVKAVRGDGQINEVKQLLAWALLRWVTIKFFFSVAEILGKLGKIS